VECIHEAHERIRDDAKIPSAPIRRQGSLQEADRTPAPQCARACSTDAEGEEDTPHQALVVSGNCAVGGCELRSRRLLHGIPRQPADAGRRPHRRLRRARPRWFAGVHRSRCSPDRPVWRRGCRLRMNGRRSLVRDRWRRRCAFHRTQGRRPCLQALVKAARPAWGIGKFGQSVRG
jgi:hypothetical protein